MHTVWRTAIIGISLGGAIIASCPADAQYTANQFVQIDQSVANIGVPICQPILGTSGNCNAGVGPGTGSLLHGTGMVDVTGQASFNAIVGSVDPGELSVGGQLSNNAIIVGSGGSGLFNVTGTTSTNVLEVGETNIGQASITGRVTVNGSIDIGGTGSVAVNGGSLNNSQGNPSYSTFSVANGGSLTISNGSSIGVSAAGLLVDGNVSVDGNSSITNNYGMTLNSSSAVLNVSNGSSVTNSGGFYIFNGSASVTGGSSISAAAANVGVLVQNGSLALSDGSTLSIGQPTQPGPDQLEVGDRYGQEVGTLTVSGGSSVTTSGLDIEPQSIVSVVGNGSTITSTFPTIQANPALAVEGDLSIKDGGSITTTTTGLGYSTESPNAPAGSISIDGPGSSLTSLNSINLGASPTSLSSISITNGASVNIGSAADILGSAGGLAIANGGNLTLIADTANPNLGPQITTTGDLQLGGAIKIVTDGPTAAGNIFIPLIDSSSVNLANGATSLSLSAPTVDPTTGDYNYAIGNLLDAQTANILVPQGLNLVPTEKQETINGITTDIFGLAPPTPPPTLLQLAQLSQDAYNQTPSGIAGYTPITSLITSYHGFQAIPYQSPDGSQVVIAFAESDADPNSLATAKNFLSDTVFQANSADTTTIGDANLAATALQSVQAVYSNANITLTGHGFGGAIAQVLGEASGYKTDAFNAPGAALIYNSLASQGSVSSIIGLSKESGNQNIDYRMFGDQASQLGAPIGGIDSVVTFASDAPITSVDAAFLNIDEEYSIKTVINQISAGASAMSCAQGAYLGVPAACFSTGYANSPNASLLAVGLYYTSSPSIVTKAPGFFEYAEKVFEYDFEVTNYKALIKLIFDPIGGTEFYFTENSGSPYFNSIAFPSISGVGSYDVRCESNGVWSNYQNIGPDEDFFCGANTSSIDFIPLDDVGQFTSIPDEFLFDASLATDGNFSGTLYEAEGGTPPGNPVPEPDSLFTLLTGVGGLMAWGAYKGNVKSKELFPT